MFLGNSSLLSKTSVIRQLCWFFRETLKDTYYFEAPYSMNYNTSLFQTLLLTAFVFKLFLKTTTQVLSCECCENFKNTYFEEHLRTAAFEMEYKITRCSLASPSILLQFNKEKPRKNFFLITLLNDHQSTTSICFPHGLFSKIKFSLA